MSKTMWIIVAVIAALLFGPQLMSILGWLIGGIVSVGVTGLVMLVVGAAIFFGVVAVGGSVLVAIACVFGAMVLAVLSSLWPVLIVVGLLYLFFRKRPQSV